MKILFISSFLFAVFFAGGVLHAAWTSPIGAPAQSSNALPPLTEGSDSQVKPGALSVGSLLADNVVHVQGGTASVPSGAVSLEVDGKLGSDEFCSEMGGACFTASEMTTFLGL